MDARRWLALTVVTVAASGSGLASTAGADPGGAQVVNHLAPVQLQWNVTGELAMPGALGLHARANGYLPVVPIYLGGAAAIFYGTDPSHLAGERSTVSTRHLLGHTLLEARAGLSLGGWTRRRLESYDTTVMPLGNNEEMVNTQVYEASYAAYRRWTVFAGYRRRQVDATCPDDASLPEDCADLSRHQFMLGYLDLFAVDSNIPAGRTKRSKTWDVHVLYTPANDYVRTSLGRRLGLEVEVTFGGSGNGAIVFGGGWDGDLALLTMGMGYGKPSSFTGTAPANRSIHD